MIIYKITNKINGKYYIGQTIRKLEIRWYHHYTTKRGTYISAAIQKYGKENFSIEEIAQYKNQKDLNNAEEYYINFYNCLVPYGYNLQLGGNGPGAMHEETKQKISSANLYNSSRTGKKHSQDTKNKISRALMGHKHSEQTKSKISAAIKTRKISSETKIKMSQRRIEYWAKRKNA